jgi:ABC-type bacteriocin/lantibiotic exporter with double-glycine peptidase domain
VPREDVERASTLANAHGFIRELPEGYATHVGEGGVRLSGGQRQQIAIARALLGEPRLLILDEPTNHLDAAAVGKLMQNLRTIKGSTTVLILTHDSKVLREAEHVYRLREGRVEAGGQEAAPSPPMDLTRTSPLNE